MSLLDEEEHAMTIHLRSVQHLGVPVSSMEVSLRFYQDVFGAVPEFTDVVDHPAVSAAVQIPDAKIKIAFIRIGNTFLELLEYTNPVGAPYDRRNCDVGAIHICFEVEDIHSAWDELKTKGVAVSADPFTLQGGPLDGYTFGYFKDPDGIQLEFFELPK
jgi:catechol 2,3-dioxygenase-like lactoylglutathione lyase family enzyme